MPTPSPAPDRPSRLLPWLLATLAACGSPPRAPAPPAAEPEAPAPRSESPVTSPEALPGLEGHTLVLMGPIVFETGTNELTAESEGPLRQLERYLAAKPAITLLRIEGHTDGDGDPAALQALSEARALAVARRLVALGVSCKRLLPVGFGSTKPVAAEDTPAGKAALSSLRETLPRSFFGRLARHSNQRGYL
jgi:OOP family OmpA-OmpF porin